LVEGKRWPAMVRKEPLRASIRREIASNGRLEEGEGRSVRVASVGAAQYLYV
jgi:hypothetical protein